MSYYNNYCEEKINNLHMLFIAVLKQDGSLDQQLSLQINYNETAPYNEAKSQ